MGLEAQQEAVRLFTEREGYQITAHFTEIEKKDKRLQLLAALDFHQRPNLEKAIE